MDGIKLKPCLFCSGEAELVNYVEKYVPLRSAAYIKCSKCNAKTASHEDRKGNFEYMYKTIEAWNRRIDK